MKVSNTIYTIKNLEEKTGIKVRTIRFYIKEQLVPPPNGTGGGASYDDVHLLSLQAIKVLHESQIKLNGIKEALTGMSMDQMRALVAEAETGKRSWDSASLKNWVRPVVSSATKTIPQNFSFAAIGSQKDVQVAPTPPPSILGKLTRQTTPAQETWLRICPINGVEIQVREDVDPKIKELVMRLIDQLQKQ